MRNPNPVVMVGICRRCGTEVRLFENDAEEYLANVPHGLAHTVCPVEPEAAQEGGLSGD